MNEDTKYIRKTERYLTDKVSKKFKSCIIDKNSVCISCIGTNMGKVFMVDRDTITNQQINSITKITNYYANYAETNPYPMGGYGDSFKNWVVRKTRTGYAPAYMSCGNGSAMRVGPVGWAFNTKEDTMKAAKISAEGTHNHPEGIKGAQATAICIFLARNGASNEDIQQCMEKDFNYQFPWTVAELQSRYSWDGVDGKGNGAICQDSVPQSILCALQATSFEDAIRNAISIGGDSDTIGCITGSIAEAIYGVPTDIYQKAISYLPDNFQKIVTAFETKYGSGRLAHKKG